MEAVCSSKTLKSLWLLLSVPRQEHNILEAPAVHKQPQPSSPQAVGSSAKPTWVPGKAGNTAAECAYT